MCCLVSTTDGAAIGFRTKVINFCLFTFNDDFIRQIRSLMYIFFSFFIIMLYYIFFIWNSCSILLIYSNMLIEKWFLFFTISTIFSLQFRFFDVHMLGQTTRLLVKIALSMVYHTNLRAQKSNVHLIT